jgi:hypothetical protein
MSARFCASLHQNRAQERRYSFVFTRYMERAIKDDQVLPGRQERLLHVLTRRTKMTRTTKLIAPLAVLTALAVPAFAQDAAIDINGDGMYSFPEVQAVMPEMTEDDFTVLDTSGDGLLDADEIAVATEAGMLPA